MKQDLGRICNLVFYSGGTDEGNSIIHRELSQLKGRKARSFTYVPFSHENGEFYYKKFIKRYRKYGFKKFRYFACDSDFLKKEMDQALKSDVIYLAGGNTFYFLKHLRESGLLNRLKSFVKRGGVLAGLSAGAIIMTPQIRLAGYPPHEGDENEVRLKNLKGLNLVSFEFLPHFSNSKKTNDSMLRYSRKKSNPIFACPDGSGIIVSRNQIRFYGPIYMFLRGQKIKFN